MLFDIIIACFKCLSIFVFNTCRQTMCGFFSDPAPTPKFLKVNFLRKLLIFFSKMRDFIKKNSLDKFYISNCHTGNKLKLKNSSLFSRLFYKIFTSFSKKNGSLRGDRNKHMRVPCMVPWYMAMPCFSHGIAWSMHGFHNLEKR